MVRIRYAIYDSRPSAECDLDLWETAYDCGTDQLDCHRSDHTDWRDLDPAWRHWSSGELVTEEVLKKKERQWDFKRAATVDHYLIWNGPGVLEVPSNTAPPQHPNP